ncbi:MAG: DNA alkylation repair protein [Chloroflexota bacterium]
MPSLSPHFLSLEITSRLRALPNRKTATVRGLRREYSHQLKDADPKTVLATALQLLNESEFDCRFIAYELVHYHRPALRSLRAKELKQLGRGMDRWEAVDTFAPLLAGPAWREGQAPDSLIHGWARSKDRWRRRAALVSTVALNNKARGGKGVAARTLAVCKLLARDRDDMVVKATSWALRALAVRDPKAVERFLAQNREALAPRVLREVRNKLTTGLKNPKVR